VASSQRSCGVHAEDGQIDAMDCVGPYYHYFAVFNVLGHRSIVIF
jgi:hypothetical protein